MSSSVHISWASRADCTRHTVPFHVDPRNLVTLSIQLDISVPRVANTHGAPGFEGEREPPLLPCPHCTRIAREKDIRTVAHVLQPAKDMVWMLTVVSCSELVLVIWPLYPSNWIFQYPEWLTPRRRLDSRAKASLHSSLFPSKIGYNNSSGITIRPLDTDY